MDVHSSDSSFEAGFGLGLEIGLTLVQTCWAVDLKDV
jgi:hypothetical protein